MLSDSAILKKIQRQPRQTAGYKQLVRELGLHGDERRELHERLQKLIAAGQLLPVESDRYAIPQAALDKNLVVGRLTMHRDGFGFVIPEISSASPALKSRLSGDIFVPPHAVGSAMHGDRVLVEVVDVPNGGRRFPLWVAPQLRHADGSEDLARHRDPAWNGVSGRAVVGPFARLRAS